MKKGFTLAELLGVLVVLALIAMITFPVVTNSLSSSKIKLCDAQLKQIENAARAYGADHLEILPANSGDTYNVTLATLSSEGYIDSKIENPVTGKKFNANSVYVTITRENKKYTYEIDNTTKLTCK